MKTYWVILWSLWAARLVRQPTMPVRVTGGWLQGEVAYDGSHKRYMAVPYASHPAKRFLAPGPEPTWQGVFDAIDENVRCLQDANGRKIEGIKECLVVNIYTPIDATVGTKYPVMVFIHGGGFLEGSGDSAMYSTYFLVTKGVIVITMNYRLNIQGFGCLRIKEAPGNAGMKDQVAALRWIQRNIEVFGGDPNSVTIFGESAGAASVSLHILSPMSKGLFHKAIIQSGSALVSWALQFKPVFMASLLTKVMGYVTKEPYEIYKILMAKSDEDLILTKVPRKENNIILSECLYSPCVEHIIDGVEPFLTDVPYNLLSKGKYNKVPIIIGYNNAEGLLFASMETEEMIPKIMLEKSLPKNLEIPHKKRIEIGEKLMKFYVGNEKISLENLANISRFYGEAYFTVSILEETELYLETNNHPVYSYIFSYEGWRNFLKKTLRKELKDVPGATHADDIFYLFNMPNVPSLFENKMIDRMTTMWTNFAKYGDPTPEISDMLPVKWLPANKTSPYSFVIDKEFSTTPLWTTDSLKYLREVFAKYRRKND
ncbi:unnamed protein product, partial [Brenthis ino]